MSEPFPCTPPPRRPTLAGLEHCWARGLLSNEELLGCLLRYLVRQEQNQELNAQNQEPRTKNQGAQNQELNAQNQEPRTKNRIHQGHEGHEGREGSEIEELKTQHAKLNTELRELKTQNATLKTQLLGLSRLLWQFGDTIDVLTGEELDIWQEGGRWYWRWEDTNSVSPRGLRSHGEALVDAIEHRAGLLALE